MGSKVNKVATLLNIIPSASQPISFAVFDIKMIIPDEDLLAENAVDLVRAKVVMFKERFCTFLERIEASLDMIEENDDYEPPTAEDIWNEVNSWTT